MNLDNKHVFITGASSGIGAACAEQFAKLGAKLLLCARREDKLKQLATKLKNNYQTDIHTFVVDVSDRAAVDRALEQLPAEWKDIDILVNNAGLALGKDKIQDANPEDWEIMIDTNVKGLLYLSRLTLKNMLKRNQGHIINIGSISGYQVYSGGVVYCATKFAVRGISEGLKMDVHGTSIRVSLINPGMVLTEFSDVRFKGDKEQSSPVYQGLTPLSAEDVAEAVLFCATRPAHVDVTEIKLYPTAQTHAFMVHRENQ